MIDIVVVNYKGYEMTEKLLNNILNITKEIEYRIICIDNSHDNEKFNILKNKFKSIIFINNDSNNTSFSRACSMGMKYSGINDVVLLNNDLFFYDSLWLKKLYEKSKEDNKIGAIQLGEINVIDKLARQPDDLILPEGLKFNTRERITFLGVYIPRIAIDDVGVMDERTFIDAKGFDDDDYCLRLKLNGYKLDVLFINFIHYLSQDTKREFTQQQISEGMNIAKNKFNEKWKHLGIKRK